MNAGSKHRFMLLLFVGIFLFSGTTRVAAAQKSILPDYVFPIPGSARLNPETSIIVRYPGTVRPSGLNAQSLQVKGTHSGVHSGRAVLADDHSTVTFYPDRAFTPGETVQVSISPDWLVQTASTQVVPLAFSFSVEPHPQTALKSSLAEFGIPSTTQIAKSPIQARNLPNGLQNDLTLPSDFPGYTINTPASADNQGYYFIAPFRIDNQPSNYLLMLDNNGEPVYYQNLPAGQTAFDFKKQPNGYLSYFDTDINGFKVLNSSYQVVSTYTAKDGYGADIHEFQLLPNNHGVFLAYDTKTVDMSQQVSGGDPQAQVIGLIIQELDGSGNVVFEWRSWDHFQITDADNHIDLIAHTIDYVHGNAIQLDWDGNYLISSRHLDEITKIDRRTGAVIWRLGGKNNQFTFTNVDLSSQYAFSFQHDIRRLPNGNITIFDNRNNLTPLFSSAEEYLLNEDTKTITRVWEYQSTTPDTYSFAMGSNQRLNNGNTVIGWGFASTFPFSKGPDVTEVKPDGTKVFEMTMDLMFFSYRAFRFPWQGNPTWPPQLNYISQAGQITLGASWNGATDVAAYKFYAAPPPNGAPQLLGTVTRTGFETQWTWTGNLADYCYFEAVAVDKNDSPLMTSNQMTTLGCLPYKSILPVVIK